MKRHVAAETSAVLGSSRSGSAPIVRHGFGVQRRSLGALVVVFACIALAPETLSAAMPALPAGATTRWVVGDPHEIVTYLTFDPASVAGKLPPSLRFVTVEELATDGVPWAVEYLAAHPAHGGRGVAFLEIVRTGVFTIDGRAPRWPEDGAMGLWCARVEPANAGTDLGPGRPLLVLELWMPDRDYVAYMLRKGHHASYGDVTLRRAPDGTWHGSIRTPDFAAAGECLPTGPASGGPGSAGTQAFFPPLTSAAKGVVRLAFAGHRVQECGASASWHLGGTHPLASALLLPPTTFQYGYDLVGGAYP